MDEFLKEKTKLTEILEEYDEYLEDTKLEYKNVYKLHSNIEEAEVQKIMLENRINILEKNINKPYFARIDFENKKDQCFDSCYIGKVGVVNYDNKIIVVDWRAPISSLYYDSNVGPTSYKVNDEIINGELKLKRQYNIENKVLVSFNDVDTVSNDELLKPYLSVSCDNRLKNIVSTIQNEQNKIIRSNINNNLIIQGVAGSGKTTVALHRIAYLVYNYRDTIKNNQYMVIGPNKFFINYISSVLPDLDVNDVKQYDLIEFTEKYLDEKFTLKDGYTNISKLKSNLDFKNMIDDYLNKKYKNLEFTDIKIKEFTLLEKSIIKNIWNELEQKNYDSLNLKIDKTILLLEKYLNDNNQKIVLKINDFFDKELIKNNNIEETRKKRTLVLQEFNKNKLSIIKKYFTKIIKKSTLIYKEFLNSINLDNYQFDNNFYYEDLSALIYINYKVNGNKEYENIKHIVIDEAQDYNEFTFFVLKKIMKNSSFSIYGDLAQSLYPYRSLSNWEEIQNKVFNNNLKINYLSKSYRTSIEIMEEANKINKYLHLCEAEAVIRHSDKVEYIKTNNKIEDLNKQLNLFIAKGLKSIAIITKEKKESENLYLKLKDIYNINIIDENNQTYTNEICILTSNLSKGLEFDGVIISDASEDIYDSNNNLDMKLLYVSMTRAMHNLSILYENKITKVLE